MPREDSLSSRFDYLFEPLDDEATVGYADSAAGERADAKAKPSAAPVRMAFAAFLLASLAFVAVIAMLLLQRPDKPSDSVNVPFHPAPMSTMAPSVASRSVPVPPPPGPSDEASPIVDAPQIVESVPDQLPAQQQPSTEARVPETRTTNTPATRAPISVAPETRAPFPNQGPQEGGAGGGGLLGVGGLL